MKNRFLGGASFLPLFAPEGKGGGTPDQPELQLDPAEVAAHGDPDWEANDPNDVGTVAVEGDGDPEPDTGKAADAEPEPVKADAGDGDGDEADPKEEDGDETEQLRKTVKALGKRLGAVTAKNRDLSTKLQASIKEVPKEEPEAAADGEQPVRSDFATKAEFDTAVQAETNRRLAVQEFNGKCNAVETKGSDQYKEKWAKAKADLAMLDDEGRIPMDLLSVALETDDPAKVLFVLGNDIERATELMGMTPIKRAIAMDKIASAKPAAADAPRSKAPPPVDPIGGKGSGDDKPSDRDSDEEWNRKEEIREREQAKRRAARGY